MDVLTGHLLLASPQIEQGPFWRSVVYVLDHAPDGAVGVIINRPTDAEVDDILPQWGASVSAPSCLFEGGPVSLNAALAVGVLAGNAAEPTLTEGWKPMLGRVGLVDLDGPLPDPGALDGLRVFAGYSGWEGGQLEREIAEGSWIVVPAHDDDLVTVRPEDLWSHVLRRQRDDRRLWATLPDDPGLN